MVSSLLLSSYGSMIEMYMYNRYFYGDEAEEEEQVICDVLFRNETIIAPKIPFHQMTILYSTSSSSTKKAVMSTTPIDDESQTLKNMCQPLAKVDAEQKVIDLYSADEGMSGMADHSVSNAEHGLCRRARLDNAWVLGP